MVAMRLFAAAAALLTLLGCATVTPEELRRADEARCRSYGFRGGTTAFSRCLLDLDLNRDADRRALAAYPDPYPIGWGAWYAGRGW